MLQQAPQLAKTATAMKLLCSRDAPAGLIHAPSVMMRQLMLVWVAAAAPGGAFTLQGTCLALATIDLVGVAMFRWHASTGRVAAAWDTLMSALAVGLGMASLTPAEPAAVTLALWIMLDSGARFGAQRMQLIATAGFAALAGAMITSTSWIGAPLVWAAIVSTWLLVTAYVSHLLVARDRAGIAAAKAERAHAGIVRAVRDEVSAKAETATSASEFALWATNPEEARVMSRLAAHATSEIKDVSRQILAGHELPERTRELQITATAALFQAVQKTLGGVIDLTIDVVNGAPRHLLICVSSVSTCLTKVITYGSAGASGAQPAQVRMRVAFQDEGRPLSAYRIMRIEIPDWKPDRRSTGKSTWQVAAAAARALNGRIDEPEGAGGTCIINLPVEIPYCTGESASHPAPVAHDPVVVPFFPSARSHRRKVASRSVLIVEDSASTCILLEEILRHAGHEPVVSQSGEEALDRMEERHFDLVLLDLRMAGTNGLEVLKLLRVMEAGTKRTPVIVLTSLSGDSQAAIEAKRAGAAIVLPKPVTPGPLLEAIADVFRQHSSTQGVPAEVLEARHHMLSLHEAMRLHGDAQEAAAIGNWEAVRLNCRALRAVAYDLRIGSDNAMQRAGSLDAEALAARWATLSRAITATIDRKQDELSASTRSPLGAG